MSEKDADSPVAVAVREPPRHQRLRARLKSRLAARLSPERTRRATLFERQTVGRLSWQHIVTLNRWLELLGKCATGIWCAFLASLFLGVDLRDLIEGALNSGRRIEHVIALAIVLPTVVFLAARSTIGFARWRLQRELWRRDVDRLAQPPPAP